MHHISGISRKSRNGSTTTSSGSAVRAILKRTSERDAFKDAACLLRAWLDDFDTPVLHPATQ